MLCLGCLEKERDNSLAPFEEKIRNRCQADATPKKHAVQYFPLIRFKTRLFNAHQVASFDAATGPALDHVTGPISCSVQFWPLLRSITRGCRIGLIWTGPKTVCALRLTCGQKFSETPRNSIHPAPGVGTFSLFVHDHNISIGISTILWFLSI